MNMAVTISQLDYSSVIEPYVIKFWSKLCNKNECIRIKDMNTSGNIWFYRYLEALVNLTEYLGCKYLKNSIKIMHNISTILEKGNTEVTILLFSTFTAITFHRIDGDHQQLVDAMFRDTLKFLLQAEGGLSRTYILYILSTYRHHEQFLDLTSSILYNDELLINEWNLHCDVKYKSSTDWKNQLIQARDYKFVHKCLGMSSGICRTEPKQLLKSANSNFDVGDFYFDNESDFEEPSRKKSKLEFNEMESIIKKLENDTLDLRQLDGPLSDDYKRRIANVINELRNILH